MNEKDASVDVLFQPIRVGSIEAPNRIVMSPLTRNRASKGNVPTEMNATYYAQRASAGFIIAEATQICPEGQGYISTPGIHSPEQIAGWKLVTKAVHDKGGRIVLQLWHVGRISHTSLQPNGQAPVAPSAIQADAKTFVADGFVDVSKPRALELSEMPPLIETYRKAAANAIEAGFDGVEVHAANGYLIDQFLRDNANFRTDEYGGSIENRTRFLFEVTRAVVEVVGADRTAVRLSPNEERQGVNDSHPEPLFALASSGLSDLGIAFLEVREPGFEGTNGRAERTPVAPLMRAVFKGAFVLNSDYDDKKGQEALDHGRADAISYGRPFISNPDLPRRFIQGLALALDDMNTWYSQGPAGYVDYSAAE